jgi:CDGSH-type Zn-finger protein
MSQDQKDSKTSGKIEIAKNGPYKVSGKIPLAKELIVADNEGNSVEWGKGQKYPDKENYSLCRCGQTKTPPFCDGSHIACHFDGTETASKKSYAKSAELISGPELVLSDVPELCVRARFCHNKDGNVWNLTKNSDYPKAKKIAIEQACNCPAGRLVQCDNKTGKTIEPEFKPSISLVEDPSKEVSGPV